MATGLATKTSSRLTSCRTAPRTVLHIGIADRLFSVRVQTCRYHFSNAPNESFPKLLGTNPMVVIM